MRAMTKRQLARKAGVSMRTLRRWLTDPYIRHQLAPLRLKPQQVLATHRVAATTNPNCSRLYLRGLSSISRSTPLSAREAQIRTRFTAVTRAVAQRAKDLMNMTTDQANFLAQKDQPGGKKTYKAYLWSICAAAYDAEHNSAQG